MSDGYPTYRCEMCARVIFGDKKISKSDLIAFARNGDQVTGVSGVPRTVVHDCVRGGHGLARIVGVSTSEYVKAATTKPIDRTKN